MCNYTRRSRRNTTNSRHLLRGKYALGRRPHLENPNSILFAGSMFHWRVEIFYEEWCGMTCWVQTELLKCYTERSSHWLLPRIYLDLGVVFMHIGHDDLRSGRVLPGPKGQDGWITN